jgi:hypothetical protein
VASVRFGRQGGFYFIPWVPVGRALGVVCLGSVRSAWAAGAIACGGSGRPAGFPACTWLEPAAAAPAHPLNSVTASTGSVGTVPIGDLMLTTNP